jgi:hypothetical protein
MPSGGTGYTADSGVTGMYEGEDEELDYRRFDVFVFDVRWFKDVMGKVPQCSIKADCSGLFQAYTLFQVLLSNSVFLYRSYFLTIKSNY